MLIELVPNSLLLSPLRWFFFSSFFLPRGGRGEPGGGAGGGRVEIYNNPPSTKEQAHTAAVVRVDWHRKETTIAKRAASKHGGTAPAPADRAGTRAS